MTLSDSGGFLQSGDDGVIAPVPRVSIHAFCESQSLAALVSNAAQDRRMQKAAVKTQMGGVAAALSAYQEAQTPNVIVLEVGADNAGFLNGLDSLAQFCDAGTRVIVIGRINDITFYRALILRGVSDYLVEPLDLLGFIRAISELYGKSGAAPLGRLIAVCGAKGGVGASTVAHHMAWSIAHRVGMSTVIADFDLPFGTAGLNFNQDPLQGIAEAVFSSDRLDANMLDRLMTKCTDQLTLLAAPSTLGRDYDFDEVAFDGLLDLLRASAPVVVLDVPHLWSGWSRRLLGAVDEVVVVAAPDLASLRNTKNLLDALAPVRINDAKPRLVMNMVGVPNRPEIATKEFAAPINTEPSGVIPYNPKLFGAATNKGQMVAEVQGGAKFAEIFEKIGRIVVGKPELQNLKKSSLIESLKSTKLSIGIGKRS